MMKSQLQFDAERVKTWSIPSEHEFRFEVDWGHKAIVELTEGNAEITGIELAPRIPYTFYGGTKLAVFSWQGCAIQVTGALKVEYVASETPMSVYMNLHVALENRRRSALVEGDAGPRVLLVGPNDVGKTFISKILLGYALKCEHKPIYVDLDPSEGTLAVPTSVGAVVIDRMDVEETSGIPLTANPPLLYSFGHAAVEENAPAFLQIVRKLGQMCCKKASSDPLVNASGMVIDMSAWHDVLGPKMIPEICDAFQVDVIAVVGHERIFSELSKKFDDQGNTAVIVQIPKSGGVVEKDKAYRRYMMMKRVREYFYGSPKFELAPYTSSVPFHEVSVRRIPESKLAPDSALPIGAERQVQDTNLVKIDNFSVLLNTILAVSNSDLDPSTASEQDELALTDTNIAGFIYVSEVDEKKKRLTVLAPNPGKLPKTYMWLGTLRWVEL